MIELSGLALAGQSRVFEYALEHEIFIKKKVVLNMIR